MKTDTTYNGYKNYETWNIVLWLYNDEANYNTLRSYLRPYEGDGVTADDISDICHKVFDDGQTSATPDGVWLDDKQIDWEEIASIMNTDFGLLYAKAD